MLATLILPGVLAAGKEGLGMTVAARVLGQHRCAFSGIVTLPNSPDT